MTRALVLPSMALMSACAPTLDDPEGRDLWAQAAVEVGGTTIQLEVCGNGIDDDGDGLRDREDPDCEEELATFYSRFGGQLGYYGEGLEGHDWWPDWPHGTGFKAELELEGERLLLVHDLDSRAQHGQVSLYSAEEEEEPQAVVHWDTKGMPMYVEVVRSLETERDGLVFSLDDGTFHLVPGPIEGEYTAEQLSTHGDDDRH